MPFFDNLQIISVTLLIKIHTMCTTLQPKSLHEYMSMKKGDTIVHLRITRIDTNATCDHIGFHLKNKNIGDLLSIKFHRSKPDYNLGSTDKFAFAYVRLYKTVHAEGFYRKALNGVHVYLNEYRDHSWKFKLEVPVQFKTSHYMEWNPPKLTSTVVVDAKPNIKMDDEFPKLPLKLYTKPMCKSDDEFSKLPMSLQTKPGFKVDLPIMIDFLLRFLESKPINQSFTLFTYNVSSSSVDYESSMWSWSSTSLHSIDSTDMNAEFDFIMKLVDKFVPVDKLH